METVDTTICCTWQLSPAQFVINNPDWEEIIQMVLSKVKWELGCSIDNRVLKRDRKRNNVTSQNTYISIGIPCSTSRTYSLRLLRLYQRETNCCNDRIL